MAFICVVLRCGIDGWDWEGIEEKWKYVIAKGACQDSGPKWGG